MTPLHQAWARRVVDATTLAGKLEPPPPPSAEPDPPANGAAPVGDVPTAPGRPPALTIQHAR